MTRTNPNIVGRSYLGKIKVELGSFRFTGHVSDTMLKIIYDVLSFKMLLGSPKDAFKEEGKLSELFEAFDYSLVSHDTIYEATAAIYRMFSTQYNIRDLELGVIEDYKVEDNKVITEKGFKFPKLFKMYVKAPGDINKNFLLFNKIFSSKESKSVRKIRGPHEIIRANTISDLAIQDVLISKVILKSLNVKVHHNEKLPHDELVIIQDASSTMEMYKHTISAIKAFVMDSAISKGYDVRWIYATKSIHSDKIYSEDNISEIIDYDEYFKSSLDLSSILSSKDLIGKNVVIITDGTDDFNFPIHLVTHNIHLVYFKENEKLINKFSNYGKCFKASQ